MVPRGGRFERTIYSVYFVVGWSYTIHALHNISYRQARDLDDLADLFVEKGLAG